MRSAETFREIGDRYPEVNGKTGNLKFPGRGQRNTPVADSRLRFITRLRFNNRCGFRYRFGIRYGHERRRRECAAVRWREANARAEVWMVRGKHEIYGDERGG